MLDAASLEFTGQLGKQTFLQRDAHTHVHTMFYRFEVLWASRSPGVDGELSSTAEALSVAYSSTFSHLYTNTRGCRLETATIETTKGQRG